jgi:hypothetical protein
MQHCCPAQQSLACPHRRAHMHATTATLLRSCPLARCRPRAATAQPACAGSSSAHTHLFVAALVVTPASVSLCPRPHHRPCARSRLSLWAQNPIPEPRIRNTRTLIRSTRNRTTRSLVLIVNLITRIYIG